MKGIYALGALTTGLVTTIVLVGRAFFGDIFPQDRSRIVGLALGEYGNVTRIPRRALDCTSPEPSSLREACSVALGDAQLAVDVDYADPSNLRFGRCEATYRATTVTCWATWFALTGGFPRYATVPTVQPGQLHATVQWLGTGRSLPFTERHIEVDAETLRALRGRYPLDNYYERDWTVLIGIVSSIAAVVVAALGVALTGPRWRSGGTGRSDLDAPLIRLGVVAVFGVVAFCLSYAGLSITAHANGLID